MFGPYGYCTCPVFIWLLYSTSLTNTECDLFRFNQKNYIIFRIVGYGISGCEPSIMGIGPVPSIRALLAKTGLTLEEIDEVNI